MQICVCSGHCLGGHGHADLWPPKFPFPWHACQRGRLNAVVFLLIFQRCGTSIVIYKNCNQCGKAPSWCSYKPNKPTKSDRDCNGISRSPAIVQSAPGLLLCVCVCVCACVYVYVHVRGLLLISRNPLLTCLPSFSCKFRANLFRSCVHSASIDAQLL